MSCLFFFEAAPSTEIKRPSDGGVEFVKVHELVWMILSIVSQLDLGI